MNDPIKNSASILMRIQMMLTTGFERICTGLGSIRQQITHLFSGKSAESIPHGTTKPEVFLAGEKGDKTAEYIQERVAQNIGQKVISKEERVIERTEAGEAMQRLKEQKIKDICYDKKNETKLYEGNGEFFNNYQICEEAELNPDVTESAWSVSPGERMRYVPYQALKYLTKLSTLVLNNCDLRYFPNVHLLKNLKVLDIRNNPDLFMGLTKPLLTQRDLTHKLTIKLDSSVLFGREFSLNGSPEPWTIDGYDLYRDWGVCKSYQEDCRNIKYALNKLLEFEKQYHVNFEISGHGDFFKGTLLELAETPFMKDVEKVSDNESVLVGYLGFAAKLILE